MPKSKAIFLLQLVWGTGILGYEDPDYADGARELHRLHEVVHRQVELLVALRSCVGSPNNLVVQANGPLDATGITRQSYAAIEAQRLTVTRFLKVFAICE
jgi:hypothetical protein